MVSANSNKKLILLELNELTPALMERFIGEGRLPNFRKLRDQSVVYETIAAEVAPELEPWIQWVTVHTGLDYCDHHLLNLNEGHLLDAPRIWDLVSAEGHDNLVFGSMNVNTRPGFRGLLLPDPWCTEVEPTAELKRFFTFVQKNVLEYSNDRVPLTKKDYALILAFLISHGFSASTVKKIVSQLIEDRSGKNRWKRAVLLDAIMFDVFQWYWRKMKPKFASFFANSTAHFQHCYWRNMEPDKFEIKPKNPKPDEFENAIRFGYEKMDEIIGKFLNLVDSNTVLVFATAISQQPCTKYDTKGGATFHRPRNMDGFLRHLGIHNFLSTAPVMTHQYHVDFSTDADAAKAAQTLSSLELNGDRFLQVELNGHRLFVGCRVYSEVDMNSPVTSKLGLQMPMSQFFYRMEAMKSGMHDPRGILWICDPSEKPRVHQGQLPLNQVMELLLTHAGQSMELAGAR